MTREAALLLATKLKKQAMTPPLAQGTDMKANGRDMVKGMMNYPPQVQTIEALSPQTQTNTPVTGMNTGGNAAQGGMSTTTNNNTLSDPNKNKAAVPPVPKMQITPQTTAVMSNTPVYDNGAVKKTANEFVDGLLLKRAYGTTGTPRPTRKQKRSKYAKQYKKHIKKAASETPESPEYTMSRFDEALNVMVKEAAEKFELPPYNDFDGKASQELIDYQTATDKKPEYGTFTKDVQKQIKPTQEHVSGMADKLTSMDESLTAVKKDSADIREQVKKLIGVTEGIGVAAADPDVVESAIPGPVAGAIAGGGTGLVMTRLLKKNPSLVNYLTGAGIGTGLGVLASFATKKYAKNLATNINDSMTVAAAKDKK